MTQNGTARTPSGVPVERPKDLVDFHLRWALFRAEAEAARTDERLSPETRETIRWLIEMANRISEKDIC